MTETITCYRCAHHGLISEDRTLGRGEGRLCGMYPTNGRCRKPVVPVVMVPADAQVEVAPLEWRDDDLVLYWPNGDPAIKFQADGFIAMAHMGAHPLDTVAMSLGRDVVEQLGSWCDERLRKDVA